MFNNKNIYRGKTNSKPGFNPKYKPDAILSNGGYLYNSKFKVRYIKKYFGDTRQQDEMIVIFQNKFTPMLKVKEVYMPVTNGYSTYNSMMNKAKTYGAGIITYGPGGPDVKGLPILRKYYISEKEAAKLIGEGYAIYIDRDKEYPEYNKMQWWVS